MSKDQLKEKIVQAIEEIPDKDVIKSVSLFGSFLHGDNKEDSDVDLLLELQRPIGFLKLIGIKQDLEERLGREIDLRTPGDLSHFFRDKVVKEAEKIYG